MGLLAELQTPQSKSGVASQRKDQIDGHDLDIWLDFVVYGKRP